MAPALVIFTSLGAATLWAQSSPAQGGELEALRSELQSLRRDYEERISELESRIVELEGALRVRAAALPETELEVSQVDELAELREAARTAVGPAEPSTAAGQAQIAEPAVGRERNLNQLNPEISVTGDLRAVSSNRAREEFDFREFELDLQAALDPFSRMRLTVAGSGDEVEVEEAYVVYSTLPAGLELTAGRFRQELGMLNRQHLHALPQSEYPLVLSTLFGDEGLAQTGVALRWLVPRPWSSANQLVLEITDGENEIFAGDSFERLSVMGRLKNFWDLSPATYFELGLTGLAGETETGGDSRVFGTDLTLHWQPPQRSLYRELTWRTEVLRSQRDGPLGVRQDAWGGYSYIEGLLARNFSLGLRLDSAENPQDPVLRTRGLVPYATWWQSEFVRLRAELQYLEQEPLDDSETRLLLQVTWAAGPHKHETY